MRDFSNERLTLADDHGELVFATEDNSWWLGGIERSVEVAYGEHEAFARQLAARWNAVKDALEVLHHLDLSASTSMNYKVSAARDILRAAMAVNDA